MLKKKKHILLWIGKWIPAMLVLLIFGAIFVVAGCRTINSLKHYANLKNGVDEGVYVLLGGQEQYVLMTGKDTSNPVIIYLHGGPSAPDAFCTYSFADYLTEDYTFVCWDQRGSGRTWFRNADSDPDNSTATFEQAKTDLDALVDYVSERFGQEKVIIMGHSYGTILGSQYALEHPGKVSAYIGLAQVTSLEQMNRYSYEDAVARAKAAGGGTQELEAAFEVYQKDTSLANLLALRKIVLAYHPVAAQGNETWTAVTSPYFGIDDFRWFLKQMGDMQDYYALNRQLFDVTYAFDVYGRTTEFQMPVHFISGTDDWICPVDLVQEYMRVIDAPEKNMILMQGCGHDAQYARPEEFADIVRGILE